MARLSRSYKKELNLETRYMQPKVKGKMKILGMKVAPVEEKEDESSEEKKSV